MAETPEVPTSFSKILAWVEAGHLKTLLYVALGFVAVIAWNKIRDMEKDLAIARAQTATLQVEFGKLGEGYTGQGKLIQSNHDAVASALSLQGTQLTGAMVAQGNQVRALFESQGKILAELVRGRTTGDVTPGKDGSFSEVKLVQGRTEGRPPLTDVTLTYDPTNPNPKNRLVGDWQNYTEVFTPSVVEWQKKDDKSLTGTFRLTREVFGKDGTALGKEEIPLTQATATFDKSAFALPEPRRWSVLVGPMYNFKEKNYSLGLGVDYRVTTNFALTTGVTGVGSTNQNNIFLWGRYCFK